MMQTNIVSYSDAGFGAAYSLVDSNNAAINLTGKTLRMHLRLVAGDPTVWMELTDANGLIVITTRATGAISIAVPYSKLLPLPPAVYVHSLVSTDTLSNRVDIWQGTWTHNDGPTRWGNT
jgi:hypothetical protein